MMCSPTALIGRRAAVVVVHEERCQPMRRRDDASPWTGSEIEDGDERPRRCDTQWTNSSRSAARISTRAKHDLAHGLHGCPPPSGRGRRRRSRGFLNSTTYVPSSFGPMIMMRLAIGAAPFVAFRRRPGDVSRRREGFRARRVELTRREPWSGLFAVLAQPHCVAERCALYILETSRSARANWSRASSMQVALSSQTANRLGCSSSSGKYTSAAD